jgi:hypothetical protein
MENTTVFGNEVIVSNTPTTNDLRDLVSVNPHHDTVVTAPTLTPTTTEPAPAVATKTDEELDSALTDLALAARVLGNISTSIEVVLDRLTTGKPGVEAAAVTTVVDNIVGNVTPPTKLNARARTVLTMLQDNAGHFVTQGAFARVFGRGVDLSSDISRIRKHGFIVDSAQGARNNGETIARNVTGYRLSTNSQATQRRKVTAARGEIKRFLSTLITEAFGV